MAKQFMVIGLGQFGMSVTTSLVNNGAEVLAIDQDPARVEVAAAIVSSALCFDATNEDTLASTAPERRDACVCAIGHGASEGAIVCTALLRQLGAKHVVARATTPLHERILHLVGAHEVVNPERDFGERFANKLLHEGYLSEMPLGEDLVISEMRVPEQFIGGTLRDLHLPARFSVMVIAIRRHDTQLVHLPDPVEPLLSGDIWVLVTTKTTLTKLLEEWSA